MTDIFTRIKEKYTDEQLIRFEAKAREMLSQQGHPETDLMIGMTILVELAKTEAIKLLISAQKGQPNADNDDDFWQEEFNEELQCIKIFRLYQITRKNAIRNHERKIYRKKYLV